ncbi:hypothetical protein ES702_02005 [subsurface metagenome]
MDKKHTGQSLTDLFKKESQQNTKELKRQNTKTSKRQDVHMPSFSEKNKRHTIWLSPVQSKKLRLYAAENEKKMSDVIREFIDKNL